MEKIKSEEGDEEDEAAFAGKQQEKQYGADIPY